MSSAHPVNGAGKLDRARVEARSVFLQPSLFGAPSQSHKRGWISRRTKERAPIIAKMIQMQREHANNPRKDD